MAFINGIGLISPQNTIDPEVFLQSIVEHKAEYMKSVDPVYKEFLDPLQTRRLSRIIKMGITSARLCLRNAGCEMPDSIITGTGLGSVEDTEKILAELPKEEKFLNPTPFIQSTYNTISSQIAIYLRCHGYNSTYVHRTFSFESGLLDALLQLEEKSAENILVGGIDEMSLNHLMVTRRSGLWKTEIINNLELRKSMSPGAVAGEGSGYFMISASPVPGTYARITGVETIYKPSDFAFIKEKTIGFLQSNGLNLSDIDLIMVGVNGDDRWDGIYDAFTSNIFPGRPVSWFKHLCGEYHTATSFALWATANILKRQMYPPVMQLNDLQPLKIENILIYNQFRNINHSMILVSR